MRKIKRDLKFSIRKFKVGIGSVAIGAIFLISSNGEVEAAKLTNESQTTIKGTEQQESKQEEVTGTKQGNEQTIQDTEQVETKEVPEVQESEVQESEVQEPVAEESQETEESQQVETAATKEIETTDVNEKQEAPKEQEPKETLNEETEVSEPKGTETKETITDTKQGTEQQNSSQVSNKQEVQEPKQKQSETTVSKEQKVSETTKPTKSETNTQVSNTTQPEVTETKTTKKVASVKANTQSMKVANVAATNADKSNTSTVTKDNFTDYFKLNGDAKYDKNTGIVTLTTDEPSKKGSFSLNSKIDMSQSFKLKGKVNLGNKNAANKGADGIGIVFHPNSINDIGSYGGGLGIGGLPKAFGFKLDTWYNGSGEATFVPDPAAFGENRTKTMGAFVSTDENNMAVTDKDTMQFVGGPIQNMFTDILVEYDGKTKIMKITYTDTQNKSYDFIKDMTEYIDPNQSYTLALSGSTGAYTNRQEFQITEFTYVARGVANVKYVDKDTGKEIAPAIEYEGDIKGKATIDNKKNALYNQGYDFVNVTASYETQFDRQTDTVTFTTSGQNIVYYFVKANGQVISKYVDENGNKIQEPTTLNGKVGENYSSTHPSEIEGYDYLRTEGTPEGKYSRDNQTVTYVYQKADGHVTVRYVDENGNKIQEPTTLKGKVGEDYSSTHPERINEYNYLETEGNPEGKYSRDNQTVTYVYKKADGHVTVRYVDENGNKIQEPTTLNGKVGEDYSSTYPTQINEYNYLETEGTPEGKYSRDNQTVTYVYKKADGHVTVRYVDENGNKIQEPTTLKGKVGEDYSSTHPEQINEYNYLETEGNPTGEYSRDNQTVTYVYQKADGHVTVRYVDENGNPVQPDTVLNGKVGEDYSSTHPTQINEYNYLETEGTPEGKYSRDNQTVTYVYQKADGHVTVRYVDENG
ncbi:MucBP domain-containing protein, partial [Mammaliicoccus sciuri]